MLKLKSQNGTNFSIYFRHPDDSTTLCMLDILDKDEHWTTTHQVTAKRNPLDKNDRKVARKVAFTKLIRSLNPPKPVRKELWDSFWSPSESRGKQILGFDI